MKNIFRLSIVVLLGAVFLTSCGEEDKTENLKHSTRYNMMSSVENLAVIGSIDLLSLIEKSGFESNPDLPMEAIAGYKMMVKDKLDSEKTGIDLTGNNPIAISMINPEEPEFIMFTAKVTNSENVKSTIQDIVKGKYTKEEIDGDSYEFVEEDEVIVAWDNKDLVIVFSEKEDVKKIATDLLMARFVDGPDADNGMEAYLGEKADMNIYVRAENSLSALEEQKVNIPAEFVEMLEGAYYVGRGNFNDGEIAFEWDIHADKVKDSEFNALAAEAISSSFMNYLTNDKLIGFGTASINMDAIFNALKFVENDEFKFSDLEKETGLSEEQMRTMFTGEIAISFLDILSENVEVTASEDDFFQESYSYQDEKPLMVLTVGIKDSSEIGELIRLAGKAKVENGIYEMDKDAFIAFHADKLILTTDKATAEYFAQGNQFKSYTLSSSAVNNTPLFGYLNTDLNNLPKGLLKMAENEEGQMGLEFMGLFETVKFNGAFEHMEFKAIMNNKSENSLKVITDFIFKIVKENQML